MAIKILCVHGMSGFEPVATGDPTNKWFQAWKDVCSLEVAGVDTSAQLAFDYVRYDDLFVSNPTPGEVLGALGSLTGSWLHHAIAGAIGMERGLFDIHPIHWTAGMLAQWVKNEKIRVACRQRVYDKVKEFEPDVILAHSMGTLISYDAFSQIDQGPAALKNRIYVTFGCQIAHPAVIDQFGSKITPLETARFWFHLYNKDDVVFTAPVKIQAPNFAQVDVQGKEPPLANAGQNHSIEIYLEDGATQRYVWPMIAGKAADRSIVVRAMTMPSRVRSLAAPKRRALVIGINDYPDPANRLEGCVNDTFEMSAVLQECGFEPEDIRLCLNDRATAQGIRDRVDWLLDGCKDGDVRFLFYSGHGAQLPTYGADGSVTQTRETLVPYDFDWTEQNAFTDSQFCQDYSQLPYGCTFVAAFDCCHAGGLTRDGSNKFKGIDPPDDVRHRTLRWSEALQMWTSRSMPPINKNVQVGSSKSQAVFGKNQATLRLGMAGQMRLLPKKQYDAVRTAKGHRGPFMPVLIYACGQEQLASEYRNGATSYGAFTFALRTRFREARRAAGNPTFVQLVKETAATLKSLGYDQTPEIHGPKGVVGSPIPFTG